MRIAFLLRRGAVVAVTTALALVGVSASSARAASTNGSIKDLQVQVGYTHFPSQYSESGDLTSGAFVTNPTKSVATDVFIDFTAVDATGKSGDPSSTSVAYILPGQKVALAPLVSNYGIGAPVKITARVGQGRMLTLAQFEAEMKARYRTTITEPEKQLVPKFDVKYVDLGTGQRRMIGTVTGTTVELGGLNANCVAVQGGVPIGGGNDDIHVLPANTTVAVDASIGSNIVGLTPDSVVCSAWPGFTGARVGGKNAITTSLVGHAVYDPGYSPEDSMGAVVKNTSALPAYDIGADFDVRDANGQVIGKGLSLTQIPYLAPGATAYLSSKMEMDEHKGALAAVEVRASAGSYMAAKAAKAKYGLDPADWTFTIKDARYVSSPGEGAWIEGTITNNGKKATPEGVVVTAAVFQGGQAVGGAAMSLETKDGDTMQLAPGETSAFEINAGQNLPLSQAGPLTIDETRAAASISLQDLPLRSKAP